VRVLGDPHSAEEIRAAGLTFVPWTSAPVGDPASAGDDVLRDHEARTPAGGFARMRDRIVCGPAAAYAHDTLAELRRRPADVVAADALLLGTHVGAEAAGVPLAALLHFPYPFPTPGAPPFGPGLPPARGALGRARDRALAPLLVKPWDKGLPALNGARAEHGLAPLGGVIEAFTRPARTLVLSPRALDYPQRRFPAQVRFAGPRLDDPTWAEPADLPPGDEPLVLVGFSSTFMDQRAVLQRVADALGRLRVRALVTTGPAIDPATISAPKRVRLVRSAPHGAVLPHASAVITHAGHGTVVKALAAGVPLVCLPLGRDQLEVARRVSVAGAGITVGKGASPARIAAAVGRVLGESAYGSAAGRLASAIAEELREDRAVLALEALAGTGGASRSAAPASASVIASERSTI
jgi:UDP:flavonoid glycosyltransferase YjiC (YdhE family)